jgi:ribosomal protein S18 acetylase RimI-like enzyme
VTNLRAIARTPLLLASPLLRYRPEPARHAVYDGVVLTAMGGAGPGSNWVTVLGPEAPERVFGLADVFFGGSAYAVAVEVESAQPTDDALRAAGWRLDEEEPAMVLSPIPAPPQPSPPGLTIQPVTTDAAFKAFMGLSQMGRRWIPSLNAALDPAVALFVGYCGDESVASARLTCYGEVGSISGVVTAPEYRRRGFGTALTWAAISEGLRRGCTAMTLSASAMGYPVYLRMGFVHVCTYRTYVWTSEGQG